MQSAAKPQKESSKGGGGPQPEREESPGRFLHPSGSSSGGGSALHHQKTASQTSVDSSTRGEETPCTPTDDSVIPSEFADKPLVEETSLEVIDEKSAHDTEFTVLSPERFSHCKDVILRPKMNIGFIPPPFFVDPTMLASIRPPPIVETLEARLTRLTPVEHGKLGEMRSFRDSQHWPPAEVDDWMLIRYLIARNWDIKKTCKMLCQSMEWRREKKPYEVICARCLTNPNYHMACFVGWDLHRRPVIYMSHRWAMERKKVKENVDHVLEAYTHAEKMMSTGVTQWVGCVDFVTFNLLRGDGSPKKGKEVARLLQDHFPERLAVQILVDPPSKFWVLWKILSTFMDPKTKNKAAFWYTDHEPKIADEFPKIFPPHLASYLVETFNRNKIKKKDKDKEKHPPSATAATTKK